MRHGRRSGEHEVFRPAAPAPRLSSPLAAFFAGGGFRAGFFSGRRAKHLDPSASLRMRRFGRRRG